MQGITCSGFRRTSPPVSRKFALGRSIVVTLRQRRRRSYTPILSGDSSAPRPWATMTSSRLRGGRGRGRKGASDPKARSTSSPMVTYSCSGSTSSALPQLERQGRPLRLVVEFLGAAVRSHADELHEVLPGVLE